MQVIHSDCLDVLAGMADASFDAVVTDPPYNLDFMGHATGWDDYVTPRQFQAWCQSWAVECLRVLKPGGHLLAFGGCYDASTEVLTRRGWVPFPEVSKGDEFASLDPDTHEVEWQRPVEIVTKPHHGPMHGYRTNRVDLLVTPNHKMFVGGLGTGGRKFRLIPSSGVPKVVRMTKTSAGRADASQAETFTLPASFVGTSHGHKRYLPPREIPAETWAAFFGLWIAEGHATINRNAGRYGKGDCTHVATTHFNSENVAEMAAMLRPFWNVRLYPKSGRLRINDRQLYDYLVQFGKAPEKFIPDEVKAWPPRLLRIFLDWYQRGDGDDRRLYTSSRRLADDLQEVAMYAGWAADITKRDRESHGSIDGRAITPRYPEYVVALLTAQTMPEVYDRTARRAEPVRYEVDSDEWAGGMVYCVELPRHHTLYVRRNGKAVWCGNTRTYHRLACGLEDAGFELRDSIIAWCFATGFPKSLDISKALDKAAGCEREVVGTKVGQPGYSLVLQPSSQEYRLHNNPQVECSVTAPATELAQRFDGYGTALKPAWEPVVIARKPLAGTVAQNVERWGVGGINVDGCRLGSGPPRTTHANGHRSTGSGDGYGMGAYEAEVPAGRWPTNLLLCHSPNCVEGRCVEDCHVAEMDRQSGTRRSAGNYPSSSDTSGIFVDLKQGQLYGDSGGASRFYPCFRFEAKADSSERMAGPDGTKHVTVKPVDLMRWLVRLVSPPGGGLILDPFAGSGSTLVAAFLEDVECVGIEKDARYVPIIEKRLEQAKSRGAQTSLFG